MICNGITLAKETEQQLAAAFAAYAKKPTLGLVVTKSTPEIELFVRKKQEMGTRIGVEVVCVRLQNELVSEDGVVALLHETAEKYDGVVLQLPFPQGVDAERVLSLLPEVCDVDVLGAPAYSSFVAGSSTVVPPVVGAMRRVLASAQYSLAGKRVCVVGHGRLVGAPAAVWARREGADVVVVTEKTADIAAETRRADVLILGAGVPGSITPEMVHESVVVLDAGTSEAAGRLRGDADPAVAEKALLFTPTPGGIGPLTVVEIFANLHALTAAVSRAE